MARTSEDLRTERVASPVNAMPPDRRPPRPPPLRNTTGEADGSSRFSPLPSPTSGGASQQQQQHQPGSTVSIYSPTTAGEGLFGLAAPLRHASAASINPRGVASPTSSQNVSHSGSAAQSKPPSPSSSSGILEIDLASVVPPAVVLHSAHPPLQAARRSTPRVSILPEAPAASSSKQSQGSDDGGMISIADQRFVDVSGSTASNLATSSPGYPALPLLLARDGDEFRALLRLRKERKQHQSQQQQQPEIASNEAVAVVPPTQSGCAQKRFSVTDDDARVPHISPPVTPPPPPPPLATFASLPYRRSCSTSHTPSRGASPENSFITNHSVSLPPVDAPFATKSVLASSGSSLAYSANGTLISSPIATITAQFAEMPPPAPSSTATCERKKEVFNFLASYVVHGED